MVFDKKEWYKTYKGIRSHRICNWKSNGIIIDDYHNYYDTVYFPATHCETCHVEFAEEANTATSKNLDHDHSIEDQPNVRNILCKACNSSSNRLEMHSKNTSGHSNIIKTPFNTYLVHIRIRKKPTSKSFKTLNDAIKFRDEIKNNII
tara:strand:- start:43 stop:486 length:444 start_codon:yes stop_codon:yes gene_type:complete